MSPTLILHSGRAGFASLREEWEALARASGSHFVHFPAWYGAEIERAGDDGVYFLALRDEDARLFAVLPLQYRRWSAGALRVPIVQLYYPSEMGVNDVLARGPLRPYAALIGGFLRRELPPFLALRWQCALASGHAITLAHDPRQVRHTHQSKYLDFGQGLPAFWDGYSAKFKNRMAKNLRKLDELGELRLHVLSRPDELREGFGHFLEVEDSGWKGQAGTSLIRQPERQHYYRYLLDDFGRLGLCRINLLTLNDEPIAAHFAIEIRDSLYLLKIGFREDYARYSPGSILLYKVIFHYAEHTPVRKLSFVTGVGWLDSWHPSAVDAGVFYTGHEALLSRAAVHFLRWRWRLLARGRQAG